MSTGFDIDGLGRIIAVGTDAQGQSHNYLPTPTPTAAPEPSSILLVGMGCLLYGARMRLARPRG